MTLPTEPPSPLDVIEGALQRSHVHPVSGAGLSYPCPGKNCYTLDALAALATLREQQAEMEAQCAAMRTILQRIKAVNAEERDNVEDNSPEVRRELRKYVEDLDAALDGTAGRSLLETIATLREQQGERDTEAAAMRKCLDDCQGYFERQMMVDAIDEIRATLSGTAGCSLLAAQAADRERIRTLEEVLRPFAERCDGIPAEADDDQYWGDDILPVRCFRAARAAFAAGQAAFRV